MDEIKKKFKVNEYIETTLTHDEWYVQFDQWLESRNESFSDRLKGSVLSRRKSIFTEKLQKLIRDEVDRARYETATDPIMIDHKAKINKILKTYKIRTGDKVIRLIVEPSGKPPVLNQELMRFLTKRANENKYNPDTDPVLRAFRKLHWR